MNNRLHFFIINGMKPSLLHNVHKLVYKYYYIAASCLHGLHTSILYTYDCLLYVLFMHAILFLAFDLNCLTASWFVNIWMWDLLRFAPSRLQRRRLCLSFPFDSSISSFTSTEDNPRLQTLVSLIKFYIIYYIIWHWPSDQKVDKDQPCD